MKQMLKYISENIIKYLNFAEAKHGIVIALNSGIIIFVAPYLSSNNLPVVLLAAAGVFFCGTSILYGFSALGSRNIRRFKKRAKPEKVSLVYFKHISLFTVDGYLKAIIEEYGFPKRYKPDSFEKDLAKQIIANSKVTLLKFELFNKSIVSLTLGIILSILAIIASFVL